MSLPKYEVLLHYLHIRQWNYVLPIINLNIRVNLHVQQPLLVQLLIQHHIVLLINHLF